MILFCFWSTSAEHIKNGVVKHAPARLDVHKQSCHVMARERGEVGAIKKMLSEPESSGELFKELKPAARYGRRVHKSEPQT